MDLKSKDLSKSFYTNVARVQDDPVEIDEEIFAIEKVFRGFVKQPIVLLERFNILPFLNKKLLKYKQNRDTVIATERSNNLSLHLHKLSLKCCVVLVRDNLEKLKNDINKGITNCNSKRSSASNVFNLHCSTCKKSCKSVKRLKNHEAKKHVTSKSEYLQPPKRVSFSEHIIVHEVQEYHRCKKCTKIFKDYKSLKVHNKRKHKKRKCYICNYCSIKFLDRILFKNHIKLHCDSCGILLQNKALYVEHRHNICRILKLYNCNTCNENYLRFMDLKDHSYEHISSCFVCDICKDQFETKCAIAHHISFLHSEKRPEELYITRNLGSDRLYLCNFCEESSVEKELIESHISDLPDLSNRAMTGYKDYYFCDQCLKKFDTETEMLQHKWSHFLKTSDNSQLRKDNDRIDESDSQKVMIINDDSLVVTQKNALKDNMNNEGLNMLKELNVNVGPPVALPSKLAVDKIKAINNAEKNVLINLEHSPNHQASNNKNIDFNLERIDYYNPPKKAIVDPKSKKTIISRHNCEVCGKYYSSNSTLTRHKMTQHHTAGNDELRCNICEETFVWSSLLHSHKCIRMNIPEMPFDDARPEIHLQDGNPNGLDEYNIDEDNCMVGVDFDIPDPIVELTEYDQQIITDPAPEQYNHIRNINDLRSCVVPLQNLGYKLVMQEVPIEF